MLDRFGMDSTAGRMISGAATAVGHCVGGWQIACSFWTAVRLASRPVSSRVWTSLRRGGVDQRDELVTAVTKSCGHFSVVVAAGRARVEKLAQTPMNHDSRPITRVPGNNPRYGAREDDNNNEPVPPQLTTKVSSPTIPSLCRDLPRRRSPRG